MENNITGPAGLGRPLASCTVTMNFEIDRNLEDAVDDVDDVLQTIKDRANAESVTTRESKFKGLEEIVIADDNNILREREQTEFERAVESVLIDDVQIVGFYISTF